MQVDRGGCESSEKGTERTQRGLGGLPGQAGTWTESVPRPAIDLTGSPALPENTTFPLALKR